MAADPNRTVWLFDLDDTLYPSSSGLMEALSIRISLYLERHLGLPPSLADQMREAYFGVYGSSVRGVLLHCRVEAADLLDFIHDLPVEDYLSTAPRLADELGALRGHKHLFTNAPAKYAWRALRALGLEDQFERMFDIHFSDLQGKPAPAAYGKVMRALAGQAASCWLVDDTLANLQTAKLFGWRSVWVASNEQFQPDYVDFVISDLAQLRSIDRGDGAHDLRLRAQEVP